MFYHLKTRRALQVKPLLIYCYSIVSNDVMSTSCEQRVITKEHIAMHTNLILSALYVLQYFSDKTSKSSTKLFVVSSQISYCNTIGQSSFISFATHMAHPLLKLKHSILFVMYSWLNGLYCETNG